MAFLIYQILIFQLIFAKFILSWAAAAAAAAALCCLFSFSRSYKGYETKTIALENYRLYSFRAVAAWPDAA